MAQVEYEDRRVVDRVMRQLTRRAANMGMHVTFEQFLDRFSYAIRMTWHADPELSEAEQRLDAVYAVLFYANRDGGLRNQLEAQPDVMNPIHSDLRVFRFLLDHANLATLTGASLESAYHVVSSVIEDPDSDTALLLITGRRRPAVDDDGDEDEVWDPQGDPEWYAQRRRDEFKRANPNAIAPLYRTTDLEDLSERQREAMAKAIEKHRKGPSRAAAMSRARKPRTQPKKPKKKKKLKATTTKKDVKRTA